MKSKLNVNEQKGQGRWPGPQRWSAHIMDITVSYQSLSEVNLQLETQHIKFWLAAVAYFCECMAPEVKAELSSMPT